MSTGLHQQVEIPASPSVVWETLHDTALMAECVPGCLGLEQVGETDYAAIADISIGPVRAIVHGRIELRNRVPCKSYTMEISGDAGFSGVVNGCVHVALDEIPGGTRLICRGEGSFRTGLFGLELPLAPSLAAQFVSRFFEKLRDVVAARSATVH